MKHTHGARGRFTIRLAGLFAALALVACSGVLSDTPPLTVPLAASMPGEAPEPVPLSRFFANRESTWGYKVSPDGQRLGWIASHARRATIFFRPVGDGQVGIIDTHSRARSSASSGRPIAGASSISKIATATSAITSTSLPSTLPGSGRLI